MSWHAFDKGGKWLIEHHGDSILRLAGVRGVEAWRALQAEVVQPGQLPDGLLEVQLSGRAAPVYFLLELATKAERRLTRQLVRDMMLVYLERHVLPEVVAVILRQRGRYRAATAAELRSPLGTSRCRTSWRVVELWTLPAEELLAADDVGLIPWVPLTAYDGSPEAILHECRERIDQKARPEERGNLLVVTQVMAQLLKLSPSLLQILGGKQIMIESPLIQELVEELMAEKMQNTILRFLKKRFGPVPRDIKAAMRTVTREADLDKLVDLAASCTDLEAFRARLPAR